MRKLENSTMGWLIPALLAAVAMGICAPCRAQAMAQMSVSHGSAGTGSVNANRAGTGAGTGAGGPAAARSGRNAIASAGAPSHQLPAGSGGGRNNGRASVARRSVNTVDPGLLHAARVTRGNLRRVSQSARATQAPISRRTGRPVGGNAMATPTDFGPRSRANRGRRSLAAANLMAAGRPIIDAATTGAPSAHGAGVGVSPNPSAPLRTGDSVVRVPMTRPSARYAPAAPTTLAQTSATPGPNATRNRQNQPVEMHKQSTGASAERSFTGSVAGRRHVSKSPAEPVSRIENTPIAGLTPGGKPRAPRAAWFSASSAWRSIFRVVGALGIVLGLLLVGRTLMVRLNQKNGAAGDKEKPIFEILSRHPLCKNQSLVMVRIGSQIVVLNQGKESSQSVLVVNDPAEVANLLAQVQGTKSGSAQAGFKTLLTDARREMETQPPARSHRFGAATSAIAGENDFAGSRGALSADAQGETENLDNLDDQLDEMAAARRQLMELRQQVQSVRQKLPVDI